MTDEQIAIRVAEGDIEAFAILLERHGDRIHRLAMAAAPDFDAEEAAQEAFINAFKNIGRFVQQGGSFKAWLSAITLNRCRDYWRKAYRQREVLPFSLDQAEAQWLDAAMHTASEEQYNALGRAGEAQDIITRLFEHLDREDKTLLGLRYLNEYSIKEIAAMLGWSEAKVKTRSHRARGRLKAIFDKTMAGEGSEP